MSNALTAIRDVMSQGRRQLATVLGDALDVDRLMASALREVASNPDLLACTPVSIFQSLHRAATMGLVVGAGLGHAYLVRFGSAAQLIPGYRGLVYLAVRSGAARSVVGHVVYEHDRLDLVLGRQRECRLTPAFPDRGKPIGAIAIAELEGGRQIAYAMTAEEIAVVRGASRARNGDLWVRWWDEAWAKTVVRRLIKRLPVGITADMADRLGAALERDGEFFTGEEVHEATEVQQPPSKSRVEQMRQKIAAESKPVEESA